jgi:hypothetical protein
MSISKFTTAIDGLDLSTRPKRRQALAHTITVLEYIRDREEAYQERIPFNMQGGEAYAAAADSVSILNDAIECLVDAY